MIQRKSAIFIMAIVIVGIFYCPVRSNVESKTRIVKNIKTNRNKPDSQSVVFSSQRIDLKNLDLSDPKTPKTFSVNVIFGKAIVIIDPAMKLRINANASFWSSITLPDNTKISSSDDSYGIYEANLENGSENVAKPEFIINANATFGSIIVTTE